jgi:hypothetical protein
MADGENATRAACVRGVRRMKPGVYIEVIELEEIPIASDLEERQVMLMIWVVRWSKLIEPPNSSENLCPQLFVKLGYRSGENDQAAGECRAHMIIENANAVGF